jgi:hypothetical protein
MNRKFLWGFVLIPLALIGLVDSIRRNNWTEFRETAPMMDLSMFKICDYNIKVAQARFGMSYKPKTCSEIKTSTPAMFKASEIIYEGNNVVGIRGQSLEGQLYQVDTRDKRMIRVVPVDR